MKTTLYQLDTNNNVKVWNIDVQDRGQYSETIIESGRLGSDNLVSTVTKIDSGKNIGKANETDHYYQALAEMNSKIESQLRKGYVYNLKDAKSSSILGSGILSPMLAHKYCKDGSQSSSKTLEQLGLVGKEVVVQPKLDGNRCMIRLEGNNVTMFTRKGDIMPVQLNHIIDDLKGKDFSNPVILDGELYSDEISFNTLNGLIKRIKATPEEIEKRKLIKFHLYDVMLEYGYEFRLGFIKKFASNNIIIVESRKIIATIGNIQDNLESFLLDGYEGLIIRVLNRGYENKRSWTLLKVKVFEDSEYELVGFQEDSRGGFVGAFIMKDKNGAIFNAGASGQSVETRTEMWNDQEKYLGKMATIAYFGLSEYGIPRFPKFKSIR